MPTCPVCVTVQSCILVGSGINGFYQSIVIPDATVSLSGISNNISTSGITNSLGGVVLDIQQPGNYIYSVYANSGNYISTTGTVGLGCGTPITLFLGVPVQIAVGGCNLGYTGAGLGLTVSVPALGIQSNLTPAGIGNGMITGFTLPQDQWGTYEVNILGNRYAPSSGIFGFGYCSLIKMEVTAASGYVCTSCFLDPIPTTLYGTGAGATSFSISYPDWTACVIEQAPTVEYISTCTFNGPETDPCVYSEGAVGAEIIFDPNGCTVTQSSIQTSDCKCGIDLALPCNFDNWTSYCPGQVAYGCSVDLTFNYNNAECYCISSEFLYTTVSFNSSLPFMPLPVPVNITVSMPSQLIQEINIIE